MSAGKRTERFHSKRWGVMLHFLNGGTPNEFNKVTGRYPWDERIAAFDTDLLARQLHEAGAGYFFITMTQATRFMIAPNETFDRIAGYKPGEACSTIDFPERLYNSLSKYDIDLMLYWTGDGPYYDMKAAKAFGYGREPGKEAPPVSDESFFTKWASVAEEYSRRYGQKVKGWWIDGCTPEIGYTPERTKILADALRAGNKDAILAFNKAMQDYMDNVKIYEGSDDYFAGESTDILIFPDVPFENRYFKDGPFMNGARFHALFGIGFLPDGGNRYYHFGCRGLRYTPEYLGNYISRIHKFGGVVTLDIAVDGKGSIDAEQLRALKSLKNIQK